MQLFYPSLSFIYNVLWLRLLRLVTVSSPTLSLSLQGHPRASMIGSFSGLGCMTCIAWCAQTQHRSVKHRAKTKKNQTKTTNVSTLIESIQSDYKSMMLDLATHVGGNATELHDTHHQATTCTTGFAFGQFEDDLLPQQFLITNPNPNPNFHSVHLLLMLWLISVKYLKSTGCFSGALPTQTDC